MFFKEAEVIQKSLYNNFHLESYENCEKEVLLLPINERKL